MNQYRHSKSSLFLMEIILNILFFSILATFCVQIFFKGYQLSKSTEKLHQAVTACTSIAEICQSTEGEQIGIAGQVSINNTFGLWQKSFLRCTKKCLVITAQCLCNSLILCLLQKRPLCFACRKIAGKSFYIVWM